MKAAKKILYTFGLLLSCFAPQIAYADDVIIQINCYGGNYDKSVCGYVGNQTNIQKLEASTFSSKRSAPTNPVEYVNREITSQKALTLQEERAKDSPITSQKALTSQEEGLKDSPVTLQKPLTSL